MKVIKLGYEIGSGDEVSIPLSHLIVTGITQLSGKTTTLQALIKRSGLKAIVFKTKIGEKGFSEGAMTQPYFRMRSDWQYVQSLLEATLKERLKFERSWIIEVCKGTSSLIEVKTNIDRKLAEDRLTSLSRSVYTTLSAYFDLILPQLQYANFTKTLTLRDGVNIMDLEQFKEEIQSLVIRSVLDTILMEYKDIIVVMPEAWKFLPQGRGNPCKNTADGFIRQGATNGNYLWIDSQDMANIDKSALKQVSTWILGLQQERNEVLHTLDQIPLSKRMKPKPEEVMTLKVGHFFVCTPIFTTSVYVQPAWIEDNVAKHVATGKTLVEELKGPDPIISLSMQQAEMQQQSWSLPEYQKYLQLQHLKSQKDVAELRKDFFDKIAQMQDCINRLASEMMRLSSAKQDINVDDVVGRVLQKIPFQPAIDKQALIDEILKQVPGVSGAVTYTVSPLEKITKDFLDDAKNQVLKEVATLSADEKKVLKFIEVQERGVNVTNVLEKCLFLSATSRSSRQKVNEIFKKLNGLGVSRYDPSHGVCYPSLKNRLDSMLQTFKASEQEIVQVYDHIMAEMLRSTS